MLRCLSLLVGLAFLSVPLAASAAEKTTPITIGLIAPLTGQYAVFGEQIKRGAEQAAKDLGLSLKIADDACDPKQAVTVAGQTFDAGRMLVFRPGDSISVRAGDQGARLMLLGGATMDGPRPIWWNFV